MSTTSWVRVRPAMRPHFVDLSPRAACTAAHPAHPRSSASRAYIRALPAGVSPSLSITLRAHPRRRPVTPPTADASPSSSPATRARAPAAQAIEDLRIKYEKKAEAEAAAKAAAKQKALDEAKPVEADWSLGDADDEIEKLRRVSGARARVCG
jgi:hypothetical protein